MPSETIRESCACGAEFFFHGYACGIQLGRFREIHKDHWKEVGKCSSPASTQPSEPPQPVKASPSS